MRLNTGGTVSGQAMNAKRPRQSRTSPVRHALALAGADHQRQGARRLRLVEHLGRHVPAAQPLREPQQAPQALVLRAQRRQERRGERGRITLALQLDEARP